MYYVIYRAFHRRVTTKHKLVSDVIDWNAFPTMSKAKAYVERRSPSCVLKIIHAVDQQFVDDRFFNQHFP